MKKKVSDHSTCQGLMSEGKELLHCYTASLYLIDYINNEHHEALHSGARAAIEIDDPRTGLPVFLIGHTRPHLEN